MESYQIVYNKMIENLKNKNQLNIPLVEKAFLFAEEKHSKQIRTDGSPYIEHPVVVASILESLNFDTNVLCSAILHDVVEDCGVSHEELAYNFNNSIADIVEAVSKIENKQIEKYEREIQTYQKLISIGKNNKFAFYIKFADRLHNLRTISVFPIHKQIEKVKETKQFILPLAKMFRSTFFYREIESLCFEILEKQNVVNDIISRNFDVCDKKAQNFQEKLSYLFKQTSSKTSFFKTLHCHKIKNFEFNELTKNQDLRKSYSTALLKIAFYNIFIIYDGDKILLDSILSMKENKFFKIVGYDFNSFNSFPFFVCEDNSRIKYNLYFMTTEEFIKFQNGSLDGTEISLTEEEFDRDIVSEYITVKTPTDELILLPKGSTVLDFAFKIHKDFGFSCKFALINTSNTKVPIFQKLENGDRVNLVLEQKDGICENISKLRWLTYVNNSTSKKILLKHFEKLYEN